MESHAINCIILKNYTLNVEAISEKDAIDEVSEMSSLEIAEKGSLKNIEVDYIESAE